MGQLAALRPNGVEIRERTRLELSRNSLVVHPPVGGPLAVPLSSRTSASMRDAQLDRRFVRHLCIESAGTVVDLVSPPEEGAIAPRCARLAPAPTGAWIVDGAALPIVASWFEARGSLARWTISELAALASHATPTYAAHIGERAGAIALEIASGSSGPLRGTSSALELLTPLSLAASHCERAEDALIAALSYCSRLPPDFK